MLNVKYNQGVGAKQEGSEAAATCATAAAVEGGRRGPAEQGGAEGRTPAEKRAGFPQKNIKSANKVQYEQALKKDGPRASDLRRVRPGEPPGRSEGRSGQGEGGREKEAR